MIAAADAWRGKILVLSLLVAFLTGTWCFGWANEGDDDQSLPLPQFDANQNHAERVWRQTVMCGPNSLYMLLALHNIPVDHRMIEKYVPSHREGMSLTEMKQASNALGLRTEVRRCSIDELRRGSQLPVIAYLIKDPHYLIANPHYVVVYGMTGDSVNVLDGTTGERMTFSSQKLNGIWSGYVLMPESGLSVSGLFLAFSLFGWLLLGFLTLKKNRYSITVTLVFVIWVLSGQSLVMAAQPLDKQQRESLDRVTYYRLPAKDAVNCLYLQLRLLGYTESYETFRSQVPDEGQSLSFESLANLGGKLGFQLVPAKKTVSELAKEKTPCIVHFEESGIGSGRFLLFLGINKAETKIDLIDGTYVTRVEMLCDDFRRKWTGYALIVRPSTAGSLWVPRCAAALVACGVMNWLLLLGMRKCLSQRRLRKLT